MGHCVISDHYFLGDYVLTDVPFVPHAGRWVGNLQPADT